MSNDLLSLRIQAKGVGEGSRVTRMCIFQEQAIAASLRCRDHGPWITLRPAAIAIAIALLLFPQASHAYVDPGSGSMFLQLLLASLLGAMYTLKMYWRKIRSWLTGSKKLPPPPAPKPPAEPKDP